MGKLMQLTWLLLNEEIKVFNDAYKSVIGGKLIYANDRTLLIRFISRQKKNLLVRLAEKITDKKLEDIDFTENNIDQLKVRIILRKYLGKLVFKIGFTRFLLKLKMANIYLTTKNNNL